MSRIKSLHSASASLRLTEYIGDEIISMHVELDTHGEGVRPEGFVNIRVFGTSDGARAKPSRRPLEISVDDKEVLALAHFLTAYVEQRKHLPRTKDPK